MPNWFVHEKWAQKAGIDKSIAVSVNRSIDYGLDWAILDENEVAIVENVSNIYLQLLSFHEKDIEKKYSKKNLHVKACYLHHLLDYFRETRNDINDLDLIFDKFLQEKVIEEILDKDGNIISFREELEEIFQLLRQNKQNFFDDLKGSYLLSLEKNKNDNKIH